MAGRPGRPRRRPDSLLDDKGYDSNPNRRELRKRRILPVISRKGTPNIKGPGKLRYAIKQTFALLHQFKRRTDIHDAFVSSACSITQHHLLETPQETPIMIMLHALISERRRGGRLLQGCRSGGINSAIRGSGNMNRRIFKSEDVDRIDFIMAKAFAGDPTCKWAIPLETPERDRWLRGFWHAWQMFARRHGGFVLMDSAGTCAYVTESHHGTPLPEEDIKQFRDHIRELTGPAAERCVMLMDLLDSYKPKGLPPHCHGCFAGALPDGHEKGSVADMLNWLKGYTDTMGVEMYGEAFSIPALQRWIRGGFRPIGSPIQLPDNSGEVYPILTKWHSPTRFEWSY